ncbi:muskelin [Phymastichus coffea]|uniref:muskelin n=1 Tax=Phymastichus coffea TaxID=108790 RepID=UPI00273AC5A8|nr:muskelin [Phymastichus coffea]
MYSTDINMASNEESDFQKVLEYSIFKCSSYSSTFTPENIITDKPKDEKSCWLTANDNHPQFVILKLLQPSIVRNITFGKSEKVPICSVRKFKIHGGLEPEHMMELLTGDLKYNSMPETFELKCTVGNLENYFPVRYIKIVLLQSWGRSMNYSLWYVQLTGTDSFKIVKPSIDWLNMYQQKEIVRLCMKHFRKYQQQEIFETLQKYTGVQLENPILSELYDVLVVKGDYVQAEKFITDAVEKGILNEYINAQSYQVLWTKMLSPDPKPGMRGGHQMVLDPAAEVLYLFGGWNGHEDLADLWAYNINSSTWSLICKDTSQIGGPNARSCHKMCLDPEKRQIFTLGRYLDTQHRLPENLKNDFYVYNIESNEWTLISEDTAAVGGPELIFDHQMLMDVDKRTIYVFGGRVLIPTQSNEDNTSNSNELVFSGLYSYHVPTDTWKILACDIFRSHIQGVPLVRSRVGHSMLFHPGSRKLYIFAGQRGNEYLNDFFTYQVDINDFDGINWSDFGNDNSTHIPAAGFTQRATIDPELGEIYVLSGLSKDKDKRDENVQNSFWIYKIDTNKWSCIYRNENTGEKYWRKMENYEPCPRFAHQLVYDHIRKVHYLFGGNPGRACLPKLRLDDFWQLQLCKPSHDQILKKCKLIIRKHKFEELAMSNSIAALQYLQTNVSEIIDHEDKEQRNEFQMLASLLFRESTDFGDESMQNNEGTNNFLSINSDDPVARKIHSRRIELYDKLSEFFPESLTQPRANLIDLLPL